MPTYKFTRYGGLSPVKQTHYDPDMPGVHYPPARKGLYALPWNVKNWFVIPYKHNKNGKPVLSDHVEYVRNKKGEIVKVFWKDHILGDNIPKEAANPHYDFDNYESSPIKSDMIYNAFWKEYDEFGEPVNYEESNFLYGVYVKFKKPRTFEYSGTIWHHLQEYVNIPEHLILKKKGSWVLTDMATYIKYLNKTLMVNVDKDYANGKSVWKYCEDLLEVFIEKVK